MTNTQEQENISESVNKNLNDKIAKMSNECEVSLEVSLDMITSITKKLKLQCSPGYDGIMSSEHFLHGSSSKLHELLSKFSSGLLHFHVVPKVFNTGVIHQVIKNSTINPNSTSSYLLLLASHSQK